MITGEARATNLVEGERFQLETLTRGAALQKSQSRLRQPLAAARLRGGGLVDAHQIAGWVPDGEIPGAPELICRLLHDLGT